MSNFPKYSPGAEEAGLLALELFQDLLELLKQKQILTSSEVAGLLESTASRLNQSPNALSKRGARFIHEAMLPTIEQ